MTFDWEGLISRPLRRRPPRQRQKIGSSGQLTIFRMTPNNVYLNLPRVSSLDSACAATTAAGMLGHQPGGNLSHDSPPPNLADGKAWPLGHDFKNFDIQNFFPKYRMNGLAKYDDRTNISIYRIFVRRLEIITAKKLPGVPEPEEIAQKVRSLRKKRGVSQGELARLLQFSPSRLCEIEKGKGSFSAEQLIFLLKFFNVPLSHFETSPADPGDAIQKALAHYGAEHLVENRDLLPSERLEQLDTVIRETLLDAGSAR